MDVTTVAHRIAAGAPLEQLPLRAGAEVVVRVERAAGAGGRGTISLAGVLLSAQLPPGVAAGARLPVRVVRVSAEQVVLRLRADIRAEEPAAEHGGGRDGAARAAGAFAVSGEPELVELATLLQQPGLALPLPNGDALELRVPPDDKEAGGREAEEAGEASFVLHSATLGAIDVRLRLAGGALAVDVAVDGATEEPARGGAPALVQALRQALGGAHVQVTVTARTGAVPAPPAPRVAETVDEYA